MVNMVIADLSLDNLMQQSDLEIAINSQDDSVVKIKRIKSALERLVLTELMISKFQSLITNTTTDTNTTT